METQFRKASHSFKMKKHRIGTSAVTGTAGGTESRGSQPAALQPELLGAHLGPGGSPKKRWELLPTVSADNIFRSCHLLGPLPTLLGEWSSEGSCCEPHTCRLPTSACSVLLRIAPSSPPIPLLGIHPHQAWDSSCPQRDGGTSGGHQQGGSHHNKQPGSGSLSVPTGLRFRPSPRGTPPTSTPPPAQGAAAAPTTSSIKTTPQMLRKSCHWKHSPSK